MAVRQDAVAENPFTLNHLFQPELPRTAAGSSYGIPTSRCKIIGPFCTAA
jgi:hypothetical protein